MSYSSELSNLKVVGGTSKLGAKSEGVLMENVIELAVQFTKTTLSFGLGQSILLAHHFPVP